MQDDSHEKIVRERIRKFNLGCMVEYRLGGTVTLLNQMPINVTTVERAFPEWRITDFGKRVWDQRPDDLKEHYYVDISPLQ